MNEGKSGGNARDREGGKRVICDKESSSREKGSERGGMGERRKKGKSGAGNVKRVILFVCDLGVS